MAWGGWEWDVGLLLVGAVEPRGPGGRLSWRLPLPAGSPGMLWVSPGVLQGSLALVTFPFPSPASTKRVCYIFNILRALLVGI